MSMTAKLDSITTYSEPIQCPSAWTVVDSGDVMHEMMPEAAKRSFGNAVPKPKPELGN
jgi:hypothetical protein